MLKKLTGYEAQSLREGNVFESDEDTRCTGKGILTIGHRRASRNFLEIGRPVNIHKYTHIYVRSSGYKYTKHGLGHEGGAKHTFRREAIEESLQLVLRKEGH